ncbi:class I SAM-dependent methyltransferase [Sphingorhabdus arenilitoris]|uniref:Class I SAM-dependent methyltransferase n=1 Tax=Sphingorhabdus arenilitoris TaxID=1490041 RepID=A0ABV8RC01_9SPHN
MIFRMSFLAILSLAACKPVDTGGSSRPESSREFPLAARAVSAVAGTQFSTETARDEAGEAEMVMDWAGIEPGSTVADIGAGEGYYTVRLAKRVGPKGRVLAQDINRDALRRLGERIARERFDNVAIKEGAIDDPRLPAGSFDRIFLVHMYHEVTEPYAFLWRLEPALAKGGQVIVVDRDRPTNQHGIPPKLLFCEFEAVGFHLKGYSERLDVGGYFARFESSGERPDPGKIKACQSKN